MLEWLPIPYLESNFTGIKDSVNQGIENDVSFENFRSFDQTRRRTFADKMGCLKLINDAITCKTLTKYAFVLVLCWSLFGATLFVVFLEMEISESRFYFKCDVTGKLDKEYHEAKCYHEYYLQNHKLGVPPSALIALNFALVPIVTFIYSEFVLSSVYGLQRNRQGAEGQPRNRSRRLFISYLGLLVVSIVVGITFIVLLETKLFYPTSFPSAFLCSLNLKNRSGNFLPNQTEYSMYLFNCYNHRAGYKNVWIKTVTALNGILIFCAFLEIVCILSRARKGRRFMDNWQFYADHLKSNSDEQREVQPETMPLVEPENRAISTSGYPREPDKSERSQEITVSSEHPEHAQAQKDFQSSIQILKENCNEQLSDLKQPFRRPNCSEGDLTMDEIYVNVAIHEGTAQKKDLDRLEQLKEYPPDVKDSHFAKPEDIMDKQHKNVLVIGRPGIGKTSLSRQILRLWASGGDFDGREVEESKFDVVFLFKFKCFNDNADLSLRELLDRAETVQRLDDAVWDFVKGNAAKVLFIFDGLDEYFAKNEIAQTDDSTFNNVEDKMPVSALYNKLAAGKLLRGASILTTSTPTAVRYIEHLNFDRIVEIRGFTSENVEDYVEKFAHDFPEAKDKLWEHIKSNTNLFSLCHIPVNCFLICHCLLQIILSNPSRPVPTKLTDIYKMTTKMIVNHNKESCSEEEQEELEETNTLHRLGEIAFKGIEEGRLLFESSGVSGLEDCGLLHKLPEVKPPTLSDESKFQFCFIHLTVQEFFAAKYLVDTMTNEEIQTFARKHINDDTWQVVLQFAAGLLKSSSSEIFMKLLPKSTEKRRNDLSSEPETLTFWPATEDKGLAVQVCKCLYEIKDEQQPVLQNKLEEITFNAVDFSACSLAQIDLAAVSHFLQNAEEVLFVDLSDNPLDERGAKEVKKFTVNRDRKVNSLFLVRNTVADKAATDFDAAQ